VQIDLAALPDDPATLQQMLREVVTAAEQQQTTLQQRDAEIDKLHLLIKRLLRQQFGRRSEQLSADQLQLALEDLEQTAAANEARRTPRRTNNASGARHALTVTTAPFRRICRAMRC
jgi:transposase